MPVGVGEVYDGKGTGVTGQQAQLLDLFTREELLLLSYDSANLCDVYDELDRPLLASVMGSDDCFRRLAAIGSNRANYRPKVQVDVIDSGIAISAADQAKVFDRFLQTEQKAKLLNYVTGLVQWGANVAPVS